MIYSARVILLLLIMLATNSSIFAEQTYYDDAPPRHSEVVRGYDMTKAYNYMDSTDIDILEGIWDFPDDMVTLSIQRFNDARFSARFKYRMVLLKAEDRSIPQGSVIGYIAETAIPHKYYLWIYSQSEGASLLTPQKCVATLSKESDYLTFVKPEIKFKFRLNFARFLPTLFKGISLSAEPSAEKIPLGFSRIYPTYDENGSKIMQIRYL